jgi:hypothetical protein
MLWLPNLIHRMHSAAVAKRHEAVPSKQLNRCVVGLSFVSRGGYIWHDQLIYFFVVEDADGVDRISHVLGVFEATRVNAPTPGMISLVVAKSSSGKETPCACPPARSIIRITEFTLPAP